VGLLGKFLFWGAHSNPGPAGSTPPNGGNSLNNLAVASKQKLLFGWVCIAKLYFGGLTSTWGLQGPPHQMGVLALRIGRGPTNKSCSWQWVYKAKFYFWGFTSPLSPQGSPSPKGVFALPSSAVLKPAQAGLVYCGTQYMKQVPAFITWLKV
jgi:hypothetical protein